MSTAVGAAASLGRYKPYPEYRDSGVEWLGRVPVPWEVLPLKRVVDPVRPVTYGIVQCGPDLPDGVPYIRPVDMDDEGGVQVDALQRTAPEIAADYARSTIRPGDVVVSIGPSFGKVMVVPPELDGANLTQGTARTAPSHRVSSSFLFWALRSKLIYEAWDSYSSGATFRALTLGTLESCEIAVPQLEEQHSITAYLDRETGKIDALIAKKERLLELLQEKRRAQIEEVVSGSADDPEVRLRFYVDLLPGYAFPSSGFSHDPEDVRLLRGANIAPGEISWDDVVYWPSTELAGFENYQLVPGDIVFGMDRPWIGSGIRVAEVAAGDVPALLLQRVARLRPRAGLLLGYLQLVLSSPQFQAYFEPLLTGISVPHVSPEQIGDFRLRLPQLEDQEVKCRSLQADLRRNLSLTGGLIRSVGRLRELRMALISAAVTGKIDVREEAA